MAFQAAATAVAIVHFGFILFVVFGGLLVLWWPRVMWLHLPAAAWGVLIELFSWYCPLTTWENYFLRQAGQAGYGGGFVAHYLMPLIYPAGLTRELEITLGLFVLALNAAIYVKVFR